MEQPGTDPRQLAIDELDYELPEDRIAKHPLAQRDRSKLLVYRGGEITDRLFRELPGELPPNSLLVLNDTRVVHARLVFHRATGAQIECMLLKPSDGRPIELALTDRGSSQWWCMLGNAKRWKGEELTLEKDGQRLSILREAQNDGEHLVRFTWGGEDSFLEQLDHFGRMPLPPYMRRAAGPADGQRYNTVFAEHPGSVAAPTASLHFTPEVLQAMAAQGVSTARITLHVGAGTFLPVKSATMDGHAMHSEEVHLPRQAVEQLLRQQGRGPVIPVGTTAMRSVESLYWFGAEVWKGGDPQEMDIEQWRPYGGAAAPSAVDALQAALGWMEKHGKAAITGHTRLLIAPGYRFKLCDALVTNFHQPRSTLLLLVGALIGPRWRDVYAHALGHGYRFLSYGDGSLLWGQHAGHGTHIPPSQ